MKIAVFLQLAPKIRVAFVIITEEDEFSTIVVIYFWDCEHFVIFKKLFCVVKVPNFTDDSNRLLLEENKLF